MREINYISRFSDQNGVSLLYISCLRYTILVGNTQTDKKGLIEKFTV